MERAPYWPPFARRCPPFLDARSRRRGLRPPRRPRPAPSAARRRRRSPRRPRRFRRGAGAARGLLLGRVGRAARVAAPGDPQGAPRGAQLDGPRVEVEVPLPLPPRDPADLAVVGDAGPAVAAVPRGGVRLRRDDHAVALPGDPRARAQPLLQEAAAQPLLLDGGELADWDPVLRAVPRLPPRAPQVAGRRRHRHRHPVGAGGAPHPRPRHEDDLGVLPDPDVRAAADVHQGAGRDADARPQLGGADRIRRRDLLLLGLEAAGVLCALHLPRRRPPPVRRPLHLGALRLPAPRREAGDVLVRRRRLEQRRPCRAVSCRVAR